jgi:hypothetical protein
MKSSRGEPSFSTFMRKADEEECGCRIPVSILEEKHVGKLEGTIAPITGGDRGIGFATAKQFVNDVGYVFK